MGRAEEKKARDARVAELHRRQAINIFGQEKAQAVMINDIKAPLLSALDILTADDSNKLDKLKAIRTLVGLVPKINELPEPTKENTWHPNAYRLIEVRDWFFAHCFLSGSRLKFMRFVFNFGIIAYDDPPYRDLIDLCKEELDKKGWDPRGSHDLIQRRWAWWNDEPNS